ncbi:helix-turn-helix domain-containing protein [Jatrophihabitans sp. DSM 45814]
MLGDGAVELPGGVMVLWGPGAMIADQAMRAAVASQRRNGLPVRAQVQSVADLASRCAQMASATSAHGSAEVPHVLDLQESLSDNAISTEEARKMLGCTERNVRDLCKRGVLESARLIDGRWRIDRAEVHGRARKQEAG